MSLSSIDFVDHLAADIEAVVQRGQQVYESDHGVVCDYKNFWLVAHNDGGEVIGVLAAYSAYAEIYVDDLWVDPGHRRNGVGRTLLGALESRYVNRGYNNINLVTNHFQAVRFYEKCGFEVEFVRTNKHHPQLSKTFFIKYFDGKRQTQGVLPTKQHPHD